MFKNYLTIAWRNLVRNKLSAFINISGLAIGMAVAMLIGIWIADELAFDHYHIHGDRIAQVMQNRTMEGQTGTVNAIPIPLAAELRNTYGSNFKYVVLSSFARNHIVAVGDKRVLKQGLYMEADAPLMLSLRMEEGDINGLRDPAGVMISRSMATSLFGNGEAINKTILLDNRANARVVGVYGDLPSNTTFSGNAFIGAWDLYYANTPGVREGGTDWGYNGFQLFVQVVPGLDMDVVSSRIRDAKLNRVSAESAKYKPEIFLHPMEKWHLRSAFTNGKNAGGKIAYLWLFGTIGVFVILLACINFMNLSTARSEKRAREAGIRKAIGSSRARLVGLFLSESLFMSLLAFVIAFLIVLSALPYFNELAGKRMLMPWDQPLFWIAGILFTLIVGFVAGSYPAFYLSSFQPVKTLKGVFIQGKYAAIPRKVLVVFQFTVFVILVIGTIVIYHQINFARERPVGYAKDDLLSVNMRTGDLHAHYGALRNELLQTGLITDAAESSSPPTDIYDIAGGFDWDGKDQNSTDQFAVVGVSFNYGSTIGWQIKEGRDFSPQFASDSAGLILNESAVRYMGLKQAVGSMVQWNGRRLKVLGVVRDIVMESPYQPVKQTIFYMDHSGGGVLNLRLRPGIPVKAALASLEEYCRKYAPAEPFTFQFADTEYDKKFSDEQRIGALSGVFSGLAILISCLGLFGLASFMAERRIKEIGIRKTLGASVFDLWRLLSEDFVVTTGIALLIAAPVGYWLMHYWLQRYTYRTGFAWWILPVTALGAILLTLATVSVQSVRAALMNPVKSLKTE